eukprot:716200-Pleurochrysis_carterae.AAC.3
MSSSRQRLRSKLHSNNFARRAQWSKPTACTRKRSATTVCEGRGCWWTFPRERRLCGERLEFAAL